MSDPFAPVPPTPPAPLAAPPGFVVRIAADLTSEQAQALAQVLALAMPRAGILFTFYGGHAAIQADMKQAILRKLAGARVTTVRDG